MTHNNFTKLPPRPIAGSYSPGDFERLVRTTLSLAEFDRLCDVLGSVNMRSRIMNNPACATAQQVVALAAMLGASPWALHFGFGLGTEKVSYEEALVWWLLDEYRTSPLPGNNNKLYEHTQKTLHTELPIIGLTDAASLQPNTGDEIGSHHQATPHRTAAAAG